MIKILKFPAYPPPHLNNLITKTPFLVLLFLWSSLTALSQNNCTCSGGGLDLSGNSISLNNLVSTSQLPAGSSSISCISVPANATLTIDIDYTFSGTVFNMGGDSRISVQPGVRLTLISNCRLSNCDDNASGWVGIVLEEGSSTTFGGQLDMSNSTLEDGLYGIDARHLSRIRLVNNELRGGVNGLILSGYVSFINFGDPDDFSGNVFENYNYAIFLDHAYEFTLGQPNSALSPVLNYIGTYYYSAVKWITAGMSVFTMSGLAENFQPIFQMMTGRPSLFTEARISPFKNAMSPHFFMYLEFRDSAYTLKTVRGL